MENFRSYLQKHKKWSLSIATLIWAILLVLTIVLGKEFDFKALLQPTAFYLFMLALIFDKERPLEAVEELYLYSQYLPKAENEILQQGFVKKMDRKNIKRYVMRRSPFRIARIKVRQHPDGYWIIRGKKKYLSSLQEYRLRFVG